MRGVVSQRVEADRRAVGDAFGAAQRQSEAVEIANSGGRLNACWVTPSRVDRRLSDNAPGVVDGRAAAGRQPIQSSKLVKGAIGVHDNRVLDACAGQVRCAGDLPGVVDAEREDERSAEAGSFWGATRVCAKRADTFGEIRRVTDAGHLARGIDAEAHRVRPVFHRLDQIEHARWSRCTDRRGPCLRP